MPIEKLEDPDTKKEFHGYLVEVRSIGGLSGSPVIAFLGPARIANDRVDIRHYFIFLVGLIRGHWSFNKAYRGFGVLEDDRKNVNAGIAVVTPATELEKLLMQDSLVKMRERHDLGESSSSLTKDKS